MNRNIVSVLLTHIFASVLCVITGFPLYNYYYDKKIDILFCVLAIFHLTLTILPYYFTGYNIIKPTKGKAKTITSIWFLSIILILISIYNFVSSDIMSYTFSIYVCSNPIAYAFMLAISDLYNNNIVNQSSWVHGIVWHIIMLIPAILPSASMWLGMQNKKKKVAKEKVTGGDPDKNTGDMN